jgi:short-subunit dehydrogenase
LSSESDISDLIQVYPEADTLVNCAGFTSYGPFANTQWEQQRAIMMVNALATARLCHHYLTGMIRKGNGHILNISSTAGESFAPYYATYVGTKAFVLQFTRSLSLEMPDGVSVSCLIPGPTATEFCSRAGMRTMRRGRVCPLAEPREVAEFGVRLMESGLMSGSPGIRNGLKRVIKRYIPEGVWSSIARVHMSRMGGT